MLAEFKSQGGFSFLKHVGGNGVTSPYADLDALADKSEDSDSSVVLEPPHSCCSVAIAISSRKAARLETERPCRLLHSRIWR